MDSENVLELDMGAFVDEVPRRKSKKVRLPLLRIEPTQERTGNGVTQLGSLAKRLGNIEPEPVPEPRVHQRPLEIFD